MRVEQACRLCAVESAQEMYEACRREFGGSDVTILCAAVADFTPEQAADHKIKKQPGQEKLALALQRTPDIAAALGEQKQNGQLLVGFALETDHELANAQRKLTEKNLDMIVLNSLQDAGAGFGYDTNKVTLLHRDGTAQALPLMAKTEVAEAICTAIETAVRE